MLHLRSYDIFSLYTYPKKNRKSQAFRTIIYVRDHKSCATIALKKFARTYKHLDPLTFFHKILVCPK